MSRKKQYLSSPLPLGPFFFNSYLPRTALFRSLSLPQEPHIPTEVTYSFTLMICKYVYWLPSLVFHPL